MGISSSPSLRSGRRTLVAAWRRKSAIFTPGNRHRPLEGQKHAGPGPLVRHPSPARPPVERDAAAGDFVAGMAHDGVAQRALARAVGPHQGVDLAAANSRLSPLRIGLSRRSRADRRWRGFRSCAY